MINIRPSSAYSNTRPAHYYESPPVMSSRGSAGSSYQSSPQHHSSSGSFNHTSQQPVRAAAVGGATRLLPTSVSATPLGDVTGRPGSGKRMDAGSKLDYGSMNCAGAQHLHLGRTASGGVVKTANTLDAKARLATSRGSSVSWDYTLHQYATGVHLSPRVSPNQSANNSRNSSLASGLLQVRPLNKDPSTILEDILI